MLALSILALPALAATAPPQTGEREVTLRIAERRLDRAIAALGRQAGVSIGIGDPRLSGLAVRPISGRMSAQQALTRLLRGSGARARAIAPNTWIIEAAPPAAIARRPVPRAPAAPPVAEEARIVVTASKRDVGLADYPGAATLVTGADITLADAARGIDAIADRTTGLTSTHLGPGRNKLFIRGIADSSFTGPTQATVGQYWGNTRVTYSAPDPGLRLYDIQSVELLEGPQGTLYGAGSLGGIIRIVPQPAQPGVLGAAGWGGVQLTAHGQPGGDAGALINLPVAGDDLAFRALAYGGIDGGYIDDRARGIADINRVETWGARAALRYAPGAVWTIDLSGAVQSIAGRDAQYADRDDAQLSRESAIAQPYRNDVVIGELAVTGNFGATRLVSTLGFVDQYVVETFDATTSAQPRGFEQSSRARLITSETRLAREGRDGGWLLGLNLLRNSTRLNRAMTIRSLSTSAPGVANLVEEATIYGEATASPLDSLALTAGARLTHSRLSGRSEGVPALIAFRNDPGARASRVETRLLPSLAARYRVNRMISLFARYQEGYRPGGLGVRTDFIQRFDPDRVATAEAGLRYRHPFDRVALQVTVATTDWRDIQADIIDGIGFPVTANIGDGRVRCAGMSLRWTPVADLSLDAALHLNDSRVTTAAPVLLAALTADKRAGGALPNVSGVSAMLGFDHRRDLASGDQLRLRGTLRYLGESTLGIGPGLDQPQGDYLDTGLDARIGDERRGLSLSITNLLDTRGNRFALGSPFLVRDADHITPLRPRSIRLGVDLNF